MIVMPFSCKIPWSPLIDGKIATVEIQAVHMFLLTFSVPGIVERRNEQEPEEGSAEKRTGQCMAAKQVKDSVPECPVQEPERNGIKRCCNGAPFPLPFIRIDLYACMLRVIRRTPVVLLA